MATRLSSSSGMRFPPLVSYSGSSSQHRLYLYRNTQQKCRTAAIIIVEATNLAAVFTHDSVADAQPQSCSLAYFFCREKWIKNALDVLNTRPVITESHFYSLAAANSFHDHLPLASCLADRVVGVVENVQKYLLQLVSVALDLGNGLVKALDQHDAAIDKVVGPQCYRATQNLIDLYLAAPYRVLARETKQVL